MASSRFSNTRLTMFTLFTLVGLILFGVGVVKLITYFQNDKVSYLGNYNADSFIDDDVVGYKLAPCTPIDVEKTVNGTSIYQAQYNVLCNGGRNAGFATGNKHLLFFGCSYTFGEGLNDTSTLPYLVNKYNYGYTPYNRGMPGYGPQQMLAILQSGMIDTLVGEPQGICIYTLLPEHIYRAVGAPYVIAGWGSRMPCFEMENDSLVNKGSFAAARPLTTLWYRLAGFCGLTSIKQWAYPTIGKEDIALTAEIIINAQAEYMRLYPDGVFYVLGYPSAYLPEAYQSLIALLNESGINVLDYSDLFQFDEAYTIAGDGHPNTLANQTIARQLTQDIFGQEP